VFHKCERTLVAQLRCHDLSLAQFDILAHLGAAEGITQQELADKLLVTKGNVTQLLDRMTTCGLLTRRQDGRANRLYLTEKGRSLSPEVPPPQEEEIARLSTALGPEDLATLATLLRKMDHALE